MERRFVAAVLLAVLTLPAGCAPEEPADGVHAAVTASFAVPFAALARDFTAATGHRVITTTGSTGGLYAQIAAGAPFEVFLAADAERPRRLEEEGRAVAGSRFTYARGRLALWWPGRRLTDGGAALAEGGFRRLAMANPATAPYGRAARQTLDALGLWPEVEAKVVLGTDVGQAWQFVATGNAEAGLVARAQLGDAEAAAAWRVPAALHAPIEQQAVLLSAGRDDPAAAALLAWLAGDAARRTLARFGYEAPGGGAG